jgi:hypothetical protein
MVGGADPTDSRPVGSVPHRQRRKQQEQERYVLETMSQCLVDWWMSSSLMGRDATDGFGDERRKEEEEKKAEDDRPVTCRCPKP